MLFSENLLCVLSVFTGQSYHCVRTPQAHFITHCANDLLALCQWLVGTVPMISWHRANAAWLCNNGVACVARIITTNHQSRLHQISNKVASCHISLAKRQIFLAKRQLFLPRHLGDMPGLLRTILLRYNMCNMLRVPTYCVKRAYCRNLATVRYSLCVTNLALLFSCLLYTSPSPRD